MARQAFDRKLLMTAWTDCTRHSLQPLSRRLWCDLHSCTENIRFTVQCPVAGRACSLPLVVERMYASLPEDHSATTWAYAYSTAFWRYDVRGQLCAQQSAHSKIDAIDQCGSSGVCIANKKDREGVESKYTDVMKTRSSPADARLLERDAKKEKMT